jgi:FlaA1/EpsC-like NDP-sugar epimerase
MTITEAVLLVLQASAMSDGRETFVLDLGKSINIVDLARELICRSGLRPGEKLFEELKADGEQMLATSHEKIRVLADAATTISNPLSHVETLRRLCEERDLAGLLGAIQILVPDYNFTGGR